MNATRRVGVVAAVLTAVAGLLGTALAQQPGAPQAECVVLPLQQHPQGTAAVYQGWMNTQIREGRGQFHFLPGSHPVACSW